MSVMLAAVLGVGLVALDAAAPRSEVSAGEEHCWTVAWVPYKTSGPRVRGDGEAICNRTVYWLQITTLLYQRACSTCPWYLDASTTMTCYNCFRMLRPTIVDCYGFLQYRTITSVSHRDVPGGPVDVDSAVSGHAGISCYS